MPAMRGRATFEAQSKRWALVMDFNALCAMEEELGVKPQEIGEKLSDSAKVVRTVFRIALEAEHGAVTDREAGALISEVGPTEAARLLGEAITSAFPEATPARGPRKKPETPTS